MPDRERRVCVVIPYYQREAGLLRRSLDSIICQELPADVRVSIIVVDDESPRPAEDELDCLSLPACCELTLMRQSNGGPAAARNKALDSLDPEAIDYVAFLDSDDSWYPRHLPTALKHLEKCDFYFANVDEDDTDLFSYSRYVADHHRPGGSGRYDPASRTIVGSEAFDALLHQCFVSTSQVVYSFKRHAHVRFIADQRRAGEDLLFWLELSRRSEKIAYSAEPMGARGWGVSIYREALDWDSVHAIDALIDGLKLQRRISAWRVSPATRRMLRRKRRQMRERLTILLLREFRRRPRIAWQGLVKVAQEVPDYFVHVPGSLVRMRSHLKALRMPPAPTGKTGSDVLEA